MNWLHCKMHKGLTFFFSFFFQISCRLETELQQRASERVERVTGTCNIGSVSERVRGWLSGEAERVSGLGPASATVTLREWEKERVSESGSETERGVWLMRESEIGESVKFKKFLLEIECLRLDFHVYSTSRSSLRHLISTCTPACFLPCQST